MSSSRKETILLLVLLSSMIISFLPTGILTPVASVGPIGSRQLNVGATANGTLNSYNPSDYYSLTLVPGYYNITVRPTPTLRSQLNIARWDRGTSGPATTTVTAIYFAYPSGTVSPAVGVKASIVLTVIPPYYDYSITVSALSSTSGGYNITVTKVSDFQPLTSLPATFSQTLKQGYQALCKFNVTGPYIYNFTLTWKASSNQIRAFAYQIGDTPQMSIVRQGVTNSVKAYGVFYPFPAYPVPTYVAVMGNTISSQNETFTLTISSFSSRGTISVNGNSTVDTITAGTSQYYALTLPLGYYYNFLLAAPAATDVNLYIHSPQTGNPGLGNTKGTLESNIGGAGVSESITNIVMFEGYAFGKVNERIQYKTAFGYGTAGYPISPYRVILEVECTSGTGGTYSLTATSTKFDTYTPGTTGNLVLNASVNQQKYYALNESIGNVCYWNSTWMLKTTIGGGNQVGLQTSVFMAAPENTYQQLVPLHTAIMATQGFISTQQVVDFMWNTYGAISLASEHDGSSVSRTAAMDIVTFRSGTRYIGFVASETSGAGIPISVDNSTFTISFRADAAPATPLSTSTPVIDSVSASSVKTYSMDLEAGHIYKISLRSGSINPSMFVIDQNGMIATDGKIQLSSPVVITEPQADNEYGFLVEVGASARYYLMVFPQYSTEGSYSVSLQDVSFAPLVGNAALFIGSIAIAAVVMLFLGYYLGTKNVFSKKRGR